MIDRQSAAPIVVQKDVQIDPRHGIIASETYQLNPDSGQSVLVDDTPIPKPVAAPLTPLPEPVIAPTQPTDHPTSSKTVGFVPVAPAAKPQVKTRVQFKSPDMGRLIVYCDTAIIGEKIIALVFAQDGNSAIAIPPDGAMTVVVGEESYPCLSGEWIFDYDTKMFLMLVRQPDA